MPSVIDELRTAGIAVRLRNGILQVAETRPGAITGTKEIILNRREQILAELSRHSQSRPYIDANGDLHIPLKCDARYRWWADGQSIEATLIELNASDAVWRRYSETPRP